MKKDEDDVVLYTLTEIIAASCFGGIAVLIVVAIATVLMRGQ